MRWLISIINKLVGEPRRLQPVRVITYIPKTLKKK